MLEIAVPQQFENIQKKECSYALMSTKVVTAVYKNGKKLLKTGKIRVKVYDPLTSLKMKMQMQF